eukprot:CAMPEP_0194084796 /NCGR_PEP_ID=MMETSP0149-20130528/14920_1 /TAXON_ID=122233 /ORGANISM="Chaetoceros debilis, Strain MM31A-1" /LENGTH=1202 /DNA_ID=CAMNT_0038767545 /DNA_START=99 /DNA_END=3707 /DNA_ORIENTATION=+
MAKHYISEEEEEGGGDGDTPQKRQRLEDGDGDEEDVEDEVEDEAPATPARGAPQDDEHEHEGTPTNAGAGTGTSTGHPAARPSRSPIKINASGKPAEAGIVTKIDLENFMCHRKVSITLCNNVNFIHGQNGSGKSAILAALQICLGAGARRTNRARNLKDLVRKEGNANQAVVRVTLLNKGPDAYQHEIYGDHITIERTISLGGSYNGFKLYGHGFIPRKSSAKSTSKKHLLELLDQLNIQIENPVAVLDQEEAKKFLMGKAEDKYNFFTKATDLERLDRHYADTKDHIYEMDENKDRMEKSIEPLSKNVEKLEQEWKQFEHLNKLEDKLSGHQINYAWSMYNNYKDELDQNQNNLVILDGKVAKRQEDVVQTEATENDTEGKKAIEEELGELTKEAEEANERRREISNELKMSLGPKKNQERAIKRHNQEMKGAQRDLAVAVRELEAKRREIMDRADSAQSVEAARAAKAKKAEEQIAEAKKISEDSRVEKSDSQQRYEQSEPRERALGQNVEQIDRQCYAVNAKVQGLKSSEGNSINMFGSKCEAMSQKVEQARRAGRFSGRVVGPIGKYLKVLPGKEKFASMAEMSLQVGLDRYIVTNSQDREVFMRLRGEIRCNTRECGVFQMRDSPRYNVIAPPCDGVETVATVINATDDLVFNCLVDNGKIDQKALMGSKDSSYEILLEDRPQGGQQIKGRNIKMVYFLPLGDYWQLSNHSLSGYSQDRQLKQTIGVDKSVAIREGEKELHQLEIEKRQLVAEFQTVKKDRHELKINWNRMKNAVDKASRDMQRLTEELERIREEAEEAENVVDDTTELEDEVNRARESHDKLKSSENNMRKALEDLLPGIDKLQNQLDEESARNEKVLMELRLAEDKLGLYLNDQEELKRSIQRKREKLERAQHVRNEQASRVEAGQQKVDETLTKAQKIAYQNKKSKESRDKSNSDDGDAHALEDEVEENVIEEMESMMPVPTRKSSEYYKERINRVRSEIIRERERRHMTETNPEIALEKYHRAKNDLEKKVFQIGKITDNVQKLVDDMKDRKKKWRSFRSHISDLTNANFDDILNRKGSSGIIKFDHENKCLDLTVQKDANNENSQTADVKALSGGERSYTTLSLLLALGECLETPFRVMDEFDVFLDPVARRIALKTMIEVAKTFEHRQFIFITPQDLSNIKTDPKLKIFHMNPPKRSEIVGGPEQQTLTM